MSEIGIFIVAGIALISSGVAFIIYMTKYFKTIKVFFEEQGKKSEELMADLEAMKAQLIAYEENTSVDLVKDVEHNESENENLPKVIKKKAENIVSSTHEDNSKNIPIYRNLREDEIPDNLQQVRILGAEKIVKGKKIKINPQRVSVSNPGETVQIDLHMDIKKDDNQ